MFTVLKITISALVIGVITEIARRYPTVGGVIAALPLVSLLSMVWLSFQGTNPADISKFAMGVLWGFPATAVMVFIIAFMLKHTFPLSIAILVGVGGWFLCLKIQETVFG
ncbi:DUF3147 family protein [Salicibibacter cibi]|uniref:DUF3147 family protein n=1 Tax=Salicibibacter cibi TaxID=2743001 RepID=A0A7T7CEQ7_9BACI|nr:DUF3147 family protein [Salicibibacter cibi]QQK79307.1 DUF3147 family protein [Salicibibacter cibi]